jgi:hypothetical protein
MRTAWLETSFARGEPLEELEQAATSAPRSRNLIALLLHPPVVRV